jgi:hypothetical protein
VPAQLTTLPHTQSKRLDWINRRLM